jgi:hypothetical protein
VQVDYIHDYVDSFENALNGPNFADSIVGYPAFADGMSFIDFYITILRGSFKVMVKDVRSLRF